MSDAEGDAKYVGFVAAKGTTGVSTLRAFLNGGFLGTSDLGLDLRVVSVDLAAPSITFQWKTSSQKVRTAFLFFFACVRLSGC